MRNPIILGVLVCLAVCLGAAAQGGHLAATREPLNLEALAKLDPASAAKSEDNKWAWYDAKALTIEGKGWTDTEAFYHRFPAKAKGVVPDPVWNLSTSTAGMCARFVTNANRIGARWTTSSANLGMPHMPATGVSGLDLYVNDAGVWRWIGNGRPAAQTNEQTLADGIPDGWHEYIVYFPLYNGLTSLEIGVQPEAALAQPPARPAGREKPMVFYGTSILQGGCASRPGMAHTSILGRWLDRPALNFGFSGNGKMEMEIEALLAEIDAAVYVLDCIPNMGSEMVTERLEPFVVALRQALPDTPIVLVENIRYQAGAFLPASRTAYESKNQALKEAYARLVAQGVAGLTYVPCDNLLGDDGEATVDGTHCTDLGYCRMAETLEPVLRGILEP
ncbi:MAG: hypothetical protein QG656_352 [Candidatus Hydrogenedentes bacterium]|nr:hypothetical protein [Candidatus Hydrogenedentota bacterium]